MERWVLLRKGGDFEAMGEKFNISPRLACLIRNRNVIGEAKVHKFLNGTIEEINDGRLMKGMEAAALIVKKKIKNKQKIRIIGDYDIDGINAAYILLEGIEGLGAEADYDIPDRITDGYGLNMELLKRAHEDGVDTIITCDNGIAAADEIAYGKSLGMTIIVTDHHEVPYEEGEEGRIYRLPPADAVIDPKQQGCEYPFSGLCGAAVAYQFVRTLCDVMGRKKKEFDYLLENAAIATVGDVMDLEDENRIIVKEGLRRLGSTRNLGLRALIECTNLEKDRIRAYHIGFILGPCMNASGRLDTAKRALELLRAKSKREADILAWDLKALNDSRKEMTEKAVVQAKELVEGTEIEKDRVLVIYLPQCHESLAGIVAGRLRESYYRPVFVLTDGKEGVKGSGRSIEAYHMYQELSKCSELLKKYGGHKLAAGFSLEKEKIETFRRMLNENCTLTQEELTEKVVIDMELPFACVTERFIQELSLLEPFGKGNTKPVFAARNVEILSGRILGKNRNVLKLRVRDATNTTLDAMYFNHGEEFLKVLKDRYGEEGVEAMLSGRQSPVTLSVTYYPELNEYMGRVTPQIVITHYQ
ncbi:MAG: single-stranded-DNA-specific exonuclease RecJ [Dorea sp.]|jgi:single-stranded-DNA-specific exonuclease RecJ|uniref:single-stranded-DNA-specific exonuclease RecJ n=1 Tax=Sporofaciens musculi TaxID=2681861 RepID=UPI00216E4E50|nr:single-stranded-DNA-specific exonuclease RecJ [Sporofaciens musculi]MCI9423093.1 single-stranded-DNA-specific exonuclease RecJ [Dorea sp.]